MSEQKSPKKELAKNIARFSGMGIQMGLTIYLGNLFGIWLESQLSWPLTEEVVTLCAVFLAMGSVIFQIMRHNS